MRSRTLILGGGMSGLAAGIVSGLPVYEAREAPGGICSSYYVRPGGSERLHVAPSDAEVYRFEIGGGHWIFGGDPAVLRFIERMAPLRRYTRRSAVYFREDQIYVPYPLQDNLRYMPQETAAKALTEIARPPGPFRTLKEWQIEHFGPTLCGKFFFAFHELYTVGLHDRIAPQDAYKSPINVGQAIRGAFEAVPAVGYNTTYAYPLDGLNTVAQRMAAASKVRYGKRAIRVDVREKVVGFADGSEEPYDSLASTLPLNAMMQLTGLVVEAESDPCTSVLVLNIGARRGPKCPTYHWCYNPDSRSGFHRVGFYSNVDRSFVPRSARADGRCVGLYIERAYARGQRPSDADVARYAESVVAELQEWGYIEDPEVVDPTWIDVAYTWRWPGSTWKKLATMALEEHDIYMFGRYGRWNFQGISDSIRDGFCVGACLREW